MLFKKTTTEKVENSDERERSLENRQDFDDEKLILLCVSGDKNAFEFLIKRYELRIYSFILSYVKNSHDAEDLTQETFLRAYKYIESFSSRSSFSTWLHSIAKNLSYTFLEHERKKNVTARAEDDPDPLETLTTNETTEDIAVKNELHEKIREEMSKLPEEFREAVVLRDINGLSYEEISVITEQKIGTVKSRISRGRAILREALSKYL